MMIALTSLAGPETFGPNRYQVKNPALTLDIKKYDTGLSSADVVLDGRQVFVHHVSHRNHCHEQGTFVIVTRELGPKPKRMQCKDIPDLPILKFLSEQPKDRHGNPRMCTWLGDGSEMPSVAVAMPEAVRNTRLPFAKMRNLVHRGLVQGCVKPKAVGDFIITDKGIAYLQKYRS